MVSGRGGRPLTCSQRRENASPSSIQPVNTSQISQTLAALFGELTAGATAPGGAYILNSGDIGLLRSLDKLSAADASRSSLGGATIAAHARHVAYGLGLNNTWAREGGNPFADAKWDEAWKTSTVNDIEWKAIRAELATEVRAWSDALSRPREVSDIELRGMIGVVAHTAYHLGAIRQIDKSIRGPREGTF